MISGSNDIIMMLHHHGNGQGVLKSKLFVELLYINSSCCSPSTWEATAGEPPSVQGQPGLYGETLPQKVKNQRHRQTNKKISIDLKYTVREMNL